MALNFPPNPVDKSIYIDPSSGLKYIFNGSVGGWETAIQPPVICNTDEEPVIELEGFLWWNHPDRMLYVYKGGDWIPIMRAGGSGGLGVPVVCDNKPPTPAREGWLWWDTVGGNLYVYYCDEADYNLTGASGSCQWVIVVNGNNSGAGDAVAIVSDVEPISPQDGQLWYNTGTDRLLIYDIDNGIWKEVGGSGGGNNSPVNLTTQEPLRSLTNSNGVTNISIDQATTTKIGAVRFAKSGDENSGDVAVTPTFLKNNDSIIGDATTTQKGVVKLAADFSDTGDVLTPGVLMAGAVSQGLGNPTGTIIMFASDLPPAGYLVCNGDTVPYGPGNVQGVSADFTDLHNLVGTSYSTNSTHKLPDMRSKFSKGYGTGNFGEYESIKLKGGVDESIDSITMLYCIKY